MKYAYYPGCSLHSTAREYEVSTKEMAAVLGIELVEIPGWICCGATPAHITMHLLSLALPVKNMLQAGELNLSEVVTCCAACFNRLKTANKFMRDDAGHREKVNEIMGAEYNGDIKTRHFLDVVINDYGLPNLRRKVRRELNGLKAACYYGCLLVRPPEVTELEDAEEPHLMDDLMAAIGASPVDWPSGTECCGASLSFTETDIALKLSGDIIQMAQDSGAQVIVVACPMCQSNLDLRQAMINKKYKREFNLPVVYFTQLVALALGIETERLGFKKHMVNPMPVLEGVLLQNV